MPTQDEINAQRTWELLQPELKYGGAVDPLPGTLSEFGPLKAAKNLPIVIKVAQLLDSLKRGESDYTEPEFEGLPVQQGVVPRRVKESRRIPKALAKEEISKAAKDTLQQKLTDRDTVYHLTDGMGFDGILKSGFIRPGIVGDPQQIPGLAGAYPNKGVSTMRYITGPKVSGKAIALELDKNKTPKLEPVSDYGYEKYRNYRLNSEYEAESKTKNKSIPLNAVKRIILNKDLINQGYLYDMEVSPEAIESLKKLQVPVMATESKPSRVAFEKKSYPIQISNLAKELMPIWKNSEIRSTGQIVKDKLTNVQIKPQALDVLSKEPKSEKRWFDFDKGSDLVFHGGSKPLSEAAQYYAKIYGMHPLANGELPLTSSKNKPGQSWFDKLKKTYLEKQEAKKALKSWYEKEVKDLSYTDIEDALDFYTNHTGKTPSLTISPEKWLNEAKNFYLGK